MFIEFYVPSPPLQSVVNNYMLCMLQVGPGEPRPVKPFAPNPEHTLYFYFGDQVDIYHYGKDKVFSAPQALIIGPQLQRVDITLPHGFAVFKVGFQPGGLHRLLGISMTELLDEPVDAQAMLGGEILQVVHQLREANNPVQMITVVEEFLLGKIQPNQPAFFGIDEVARQMGNPHGRTSIDMLASHSCLSIRQFERNFKERIGISPKLYSRLVRFSYALHLKERQPQLSWQDVIFQAGYYDQMHLVKDFKQFMSATPTGLLKSDASYGTRILSGVPGQPLVI